MTAIYEPTGKAREYAALACNPYLGCTHGCHYCYAPGALRKFRAEFHAAAAPRSDILEALAREAPNYAGDEREVLLSFIGDLYQPAEERELLARRALGILADWGVPATVLTKNPALAVLRDLDILKRGQMRLGTTVVFAQESSRQAWEPGASGLADRYNAMRVARAEGLKTWLSIEPVIYPEQALTVIREYAAVVDEIKIGRLNHLPTGPISPSGPIVPVVDWAAFAAEASALCRQLGVRYTLKESLRRISGGND